MKEIIVNKIQQLAQEAQRLSDAKLSMQKQLKEIDIRLTQITGALVELKKIEQEIGDKDGKDQATSNN